MFTFLEKISPCLVMKLKCWSIILNIDFNSHQCATLKLLIFFLSFIITPLYI